MLRPPNLVCAGSGFALELLCKPQPGTAAWKSKHELANRVQHQANQRRRLQQHSLVLQNAKIQNAPPQRKLKYLQIQTGSGAIRHKNRSFQSNTRITGNKLHFLTFSYDHSKLRRRDVCKVSRSKRTKTWCDLGNSTDDLQLKPTNPIKDIASEAMFNSHSAGPQIPCLELEGSLQCSHQSATCPWVTCIQSTTFHTSFGTKLNTFLSLTSESFKSSLRVYFSQFPSHYP